MKITTHRNTLLSLLIFGALAGTTLPSLIHAEDPPKTAITTAKPTLTVNVVTPSTERWDIQIQASGAISPWQEAVVAAEISGLRITDVLADVGQTVKEGQTLAKLSQDTVRADIAQQEALIAQAESAVIQAETSVKQAEANVDQAKSAKVQAEAGIEQSQAGVAQAQAVVMQAQAQVAQAQAGVAQANATLGQSQAQINQFAAQVGQAGAGVDQAQATLVDAQTNAARAQKLKATGALPLQQIDQYMTSAATARAALEAQKAGLTAQKAALEAQKAAFAALKSGVSAKDSEVRAQLAIVEAQKAAVAAKQAEVKAQVAGVASQESGVDAQRAAVEVQRAGLNAQKAAQAVQEAAMVNQQIRLKHTSITAPDAGTITSRSASLGAVVQAGTELFRIIRQDKLEWRAEVTGQDVGKISEGQITSVTLPTGEEVEGKVRLIAPSLDSNTRNALVYVSLPSGSGARAGMFAQGKIQNGTADKLTLPQSAVILRDGNRYVFIVNADNHVRQVKVKIGSILNGRVEILSGVTATDEVVSTGGGFLNDDDLIARATGDTALPTPTPSPTPAPTSEESTKP